MDHLAAGAYRVRGCPSLEERKVGAALVAAYSSFWCLTVLSGLPYVWNAKRSFCIRTLCITTPWLGRLMVLTLATPFLLAAVWAGRRVSRFQTNRCQEARATK